MARLLFTCDKTLIMSDEREKLLRSMLFPFFFIVLLWCIQLCKQFFNADLIFLGILPLRAEGLPGIITAPLIHADYAHLGSNSLPLFMLGSALFYFYREIAFKVIGLSWLMTGIWVWLFARGNSFHIGASGVVYALAAFHFFSGFIRRESKLMAFSLLVVFLYGSMIWGVFPEFFPHKNISWESHLMGSIAGFILSVYFRNDGIQRKVYQWNEEEEDDDENSPWKQTEETPPSPSEEQKDDSNKPFLSVHYEIKK